MGDRKMKSMVVSGIIAICYLLCGYFSGGPALALRVATALIFPLACIWFSDAMGAYTGMMGKVSITSTTPGCFVAAGGWLLLLLPLFIGLTMWISGSS